MRIVATLFFTWVFFTIACTSERPVSSEFSLQTLGKPASEFRIMPGVRSVVKGEQGTRLMFKGNEFEFEDGTKVSDTITIQLREVYDKASMIFNGITTTSSGKIIESIGMFEITAISEGKPLKVRKGRSIQVTVPNRRKIPDGELFYGEKDSTGINWVRVKSEKPPVNVKAPEPGKEEVTVPVIADSMHVQWFSVDDDGVEMFLSDTTIANDTSMYFLPDSELDAAQKNSQVDSTNRIPPNTRNNLELRPGRPPLRSNILIGQVGWVNVDRIIEIPKKNQVDLLITLERYKRPVGYIVFRDMNAVLPITFDERGNALVKSLPVNSVITLLTVDQAGDQLLVAQKEVLLRKVNKVFISPENVKEKNELTHSIEKLNL